MPGSLLLLGDPSGDRLFMLTAILFGLCLVPIALGSKGAPPNINAERIGLRDQYHFSPVGVVGAAAAGFTNAPLMGLGPIFGAKIGLGVEGVSYFMAIFLLSSVALLIAISRLSDKYDRRGVLIGVAGRLGGRLRGHDTPLYTRYMGHPGDKLYHQRSKRRRLSDRDGACERPCKPGSHGLDYGRTVARLSVGASISPFFAALAMKWVGPVGLYLYCSVIYASLAGFTYYRRMRRVPALRDYRLRGTAADLAVERCRCRPRSKGRRYRIARAGFIPCTKGRGDLPGEDRLPNPSRLLENHRHP